MNYIVKICRIHGNLPIENTKTRHKGNTVYLICSLCKRIYEQKYREKIINNKTHEWIEKERKRNKVYYEKNKEKCKIANQLWASKNKKKISEIRKSWIEKNKEWVKERGKNYIKKMPDGYLIRLINYNSITKIKSFPENFIEAKRTHLELKRKIREINNVFKQC